MKRTSKYDDAALSLNYLSRFCALSARLNSLSLTGGLSTLLLMCNLDTAFLSAVFISLHLFSITFKSTDSNSVFKIMSAVGERRLSISGNTSITSSKQAQAIEIFVEFSCNFRVIEFKFDKVEYSLSILLCCLPDSRRAKISGSSNCTINGFRSMYRLII